MKKKRCRSEARHSKARKCLGRWGRWLHLLLLLGQGMLGVSAAAEGPQRETAVLFRMRGEMQFKEERQTKSVSYRWKQPNREDRANVKKEEK